MAIKKYFRKRVLFSVIGAVFLIALIFGSGVYAKSVLNPTELSHFFVPFPAGKVIKPTTLQKPKGGAVFVRPMGIDVNARGILKKWLNPAAEGLSTHWLTNLDSKPHRIGMKFTNINFDVEWDVHAGIPWNEETHEFEVAVGPGDSVPDLGVDWVFFFPPEVRAQTVWYDGSLIVFDADTGDTLTTIPVKFQQGPIVYQRGASK